VRAFHEIVALSAHFEITLAAITHDPGDARAAEPLRQWCGELILAPAGGTVGRVRAAASIFRGRSATEGFFRSPDLERQLDRLASARPFDLVFAYCSSVLPTCLGVKAKAHVIDLVDTDSQKWLAYAGDSRWPVSWLYRGEARAVARLERQAVQRCHAVFITSQAEIEALGAESPHVLAVGNGVDTDYFRPDPGLPAPDPQSPCLVFTGWMNYRPNIDGVCWFVREVMPLLRQRLGGLTFRIVGRNPAPKVVQLARCPGVVVTGSVPDVRPYLSAATAAVVPLRIARGVQNKVLEAMAMGKPVVASSGALTGLDVVAGQEALRADSPDEWVEHILSLSGDTAACQPSQLGARARQCVVERYNWARRMAPMVDVCMKLAGCEAPVCDDLRGAPNEQVEPGRALKA
jgi:sugar transferase (PEP-CTERM/EpsH1 system associated)